MSASEPSRVSRVQESYRQLSAAATTLNTASDALSRSISTLDALLKKLGLGISAWVKFRDQDFTDPDPMRYDYDEVGYAKMGGKWGLAIRNCYGHYEHGDNEEQWPFNEAPRALRILAVEKIPDLLDQLNKDAIAAAKKIEKKAAIVDELAAAIGAIVPPEAKG